MARRKKRILAFLQNPWFKPGTQERHIAMYASDLEFRRRVLAMSATGRALRRALGDELFGEILWDNASYVHGNTRDHSSPPDVEYMRRRIQIHKPNVVLLFGRRAQDGFDDIKPQRRDMIVLRAPHPMARGSAIAHLDEISREVKRICGQ